MPPLMLAKWHIQCCYCFALVHWAVATSLAAPLLHCYLSHYHSQSCSKMTLFGSRKMKRKKLPHHRHPFPTTAALHSFASPLLPPRMQACFGHVPATAGACPPAPCNLCEWTGSTGACTSTQVGSSLACVSCMSSATHQHQPRRPAPLYPLHNFSSRLRRLHHCRYPTAQLLEPGLPSEGTTGPSSQLQPSLSTCGCAASHAQSECAQL